MKKVVWSRRAIDHLVAIRDHIAQDSPNTAADVAAKIVEVVGMLRRHPEIGRPGRIRGTRELVVVGTPYIVPYRLRGRTLDLLAVFHGKRRWPQGL